LFATAICDFFKNKNLLRPTWKLTNRRIWKSWAASLSSSKNKNIAMGLFELTLYCVRWEAIDQTDNIKKQITTKTKFNIFHIHNLLERRYSQQSTCLMTMVIFDFYFGYIIHSGQDAWLIKDLLFFTVYLRVYKNKIRKHVCLWIFLYLEANNLL